MKLRFGRLVVVALSVLGPCGIALSQGKAQGQPNDLAAGLGREFAQETAKVNGITLHYVRGGKGPAVILIHGFPQDWFEYRAIMPRLAKQFTVIAVDLRGVGACISSRRRSDWSACTLSDTTSAGWWPMHSFAVFRKRR